DGVERSDDPDGVMSQNALGALAQQPVTDVFVFGHGWMGDVPSARTQYAAWTGAMARQTSDIAKMQQRRSGFLPLLVGLHWPSPPWGDEDFDTSPSFAVSESVSVLDHYAQTLHDTPATREALQVIFRAAAVNSTPAQLPEEVRTAYAVLDREAALASDG